jgi:hypothetical protein
MNGDVAECPTNSLSCRAQRVERIAALLGEIEELSHRANEVPLPLVIDMLETLENARRILRNYAQLTLSAAADESGEPQPDVDSDILERMYRTLATGRRPPER